MQKKTRPFLLMLALALVAALAFAGSSLSGTKRAHASDTLVIADRDVSNALDPDGANSTYVPNHNAYVNLYDRLFEQKSVPNPLGNGLTASIQTYPMLAQSVTADTSGRSFTVVLREGVKSEYGNEMTAADAVFSWQRALGLGGTGAFEYAVLAKVVKVAAIGKYKVRYFTKGASPAFQPMLALAQIPIYDSTEVKKHITAADKTAKTWLADHSAGFGPWQLKSWTKAQSMIFERRDDYYGAKSQYKFVRYLAIPNSASRLATLKRGDIDVALSLSPSQIRDAAKTKGLRTANFKGNSQEWVFLNYKQKELASPLVRQALLYATPYKQIIDTVYLGDAEIAKSPLPWYLPYSTDQFWHFDTNVATAKDLLAKAGFTSSNPLTIDLYYSDSRPVQDQITAILQQGWAAAGVKVNLNKAPESTLIDRYIIKKDLPAYSTDTASPVPPDGSVLLFFHLTGGFLNGVNYSDKRWDAAFANSLAKNDPKYRAGVFKGMQKLFWANPPFLPLVTTYDQVAMKDTIGAYTWRYDHATAWAPITYVGQ